MFALRERRVHVTQARPEPPGRERAHQRASQSVRWSRVCCAECKRIIVPLDAILVCAKPKHLRHERLEGGRGVGMPTRHHIESDLPIPRLRKAVCVPRQGLCGGDSVDQAADMRQIVLAFFWKTI